MNRFFNLRNTIAVLGIFFSLGTFLSACEQQKFEPNTSVAPGGGTITTYKSYTLTSATGATVYGRVVFYKYSSAVTLVEVGLYNTTTGTPYTASIYEGKASDSAAKSLKALDTISGATGEFSTNKYYTISETGFYDKLNAYNANVKVMSGASLVASGNIGSNATPVAQSQ